MFWAELSDARRHCRADWKRSLGHFLEGGVNGSWVFVESVRSTKRADSDALGRDGPALLALLERAYIRENLGEDLASLD
jgi:hypothetical protein